MIARTWILGLLAALTITAGVVVALRVRINSNSEPTSQTSDIVVRDLVLGTPKNKQTATSANIGELSILSNYGAKEPIALKISTNAPAEQQLQLTVRLARVDGTFMSINPSTITLQGGESGFCCWNIPDSGSYNLQIFRPDGKLSSLPLVIR